MLKDRKQTIILIAVILVGALIAGGALYFYQTQKWEGKELSQKERQQLSLELTQQAEAFMNKADYGECEKLSQQAIDLDENNIDAHILLGRSKYAQGKIKEARDVYIKGLEKDPKNFNMNLNLAHIYRDLREFELSKKHYKTAIEIDPYDILVWHNYAAVYILENENWEGAAKIYEEALKVNPDDEFLKIQYEMAKENAETAD